MWWDDDEIVGRCGRYGVRLHITEVSPLVDDQECRMREYLQSRLETAGGLGLFRGK